MDEKLIERLAALEKQVSKITAGNEISNLMSKYMYYHIAFRDDLILKNAGP